MPARLPASIFFLLLALGSADAQEPAPLPSPPAIAPAPAPAEASPQPQPPPPPAAASDDGVDLMAVQIFAFGCERLAFAQDFSFRATQKINPALLKGSGRLGEIDIEVHVSRPDKLRAVARGTAGGQEIERRIHIHPLGSALLDIGSNIFVELPASESIDEAVDEIRTHFSIPVPLIDFVVNDPYTNFSARLLEAKYLGTDETNGIPCHHLIFLGKTMDWEVWISQDGLIAQKFLISVKGIPGRNHIEAVFTEWNFDVAPDEESFAFVPPEGCQKIGLPPAEFLGEEKRPAPGPKVPDSLDAEQTEKTQPSEATVAKRTINRPHLFLLPEDTPTGTVGGQRSFIVDGTHYLPYLHDGGPVFIAVDPENPPSSE